MDSKALTLNVLLMEAAPTSLLTRDVLCQRSNGGIKRLESQLRLITINVYKKVSDLYDSSEKGSGNVNMSIDSAGAGVNTDNTDKSMESLLEQIGHPTSRKRRRTRSGEVRTITLEVPENILEKTQQIATAKGISPQAHVDIIAAVISASGGNIDDFRLSRTTGYRSREKVEKVVADNAKSEFRKICQDRSRKLIVHFDGKLTEELAPMKIHKEKKDRVAMLVRSPDLEEGEQLLGAPELKSGSGMK